MTKSRMMKKLIFALIVLSNLSGSAFAADPLMKCSFRESMSTSFGYSSIYSFAGTIKDQGSNDSHFYEVDGVTAAIDRGPSTNVPGSHIGDTTGTINNAPWGGKVMIDIASKAKSGPLAFRIMVFSPAATDPVGSLPAYKITSVNGAGLAGSCSSVDSRLLPQN